MASLSWPWNCWSRRLSVFHCNWHSSILANVNGVSVLTLKLFIQAPAFMARHWHYALLPSVYTISVFTLKLLVQPSVFISCKWHSSLLANVNGVFVLALKLFVQASVFMARHWHYALLPSVNPSVLTLKLFIQASVFMWRHWHYALLPSVYTVSVFDPQIVGPAVCLYFIVTDTHHYWRMSMASLSWPWNCSSRRLSLCGVTDTMHYCQVSIPSVLTLKLLVHPSVFISL